MESAVPIVLQCPIEGSPDEIIFTISSKAILPSAKSFRLSQTTAPDPASLPFHQPSSFGPPDSTIAGMLTVAAAIRQAGVVLSQPVVSTTPSSG